MPCREAARTLRWATVAATLGPPTELVDRVSCRCGGEVLQDRRSDFRRWMPLGKKPLRKLGLGRERAGSKCLAEAS